MNCKECQLKISYNRIFCSKSCAAKFNNRKRTTESREKQRKSLLKTLGKNYYPKVKKQVDRSKASVTSFSSGPFSLVYFKNCSNCNRLFTATKNWIRVCSDICRYESRTLNYVKKQQLKYYNKHQSKNVYLHSNWEVIIANYLDELRIEWLRPNKILYWKDHNNNTRKYIPDFCLPEYNIFLDVKNPFKMEKEKDKINKLTNDFNNLYIGDIEYIKTVINALPHQ